LATAGDLLSVTLVVSAGEAETSAAGGRMVAACCVACKDCWRWSSLNLALQTRCATYLIILGNEAEIDSDVDMSLQLLVHPRVHLLYAATT